MEAARQEIYRRIPHRPPFLWVDRITALDERSVTAEKDIPPDLDLFRGHYPDYPLMPGVLLCEAVFQAGAILMAENLGQGRQQDTVSGDIPVIPVLTRIYNAKFKHLVRPGDTIRIHVVLDEIVGPAWLFKGKALVDDRVALKVEFGCTLTARNG
jgi:3-hydroxyacyl-[acyl-carrier-protein] dehydratase